MVLEQQQQHEDVQHQVQNFTGVQEQNNNSSEVMTFYQTKKYEAVPIDTIEVDDEEEGPSQNHAINSKNGVDLPVFYNSKLSDNTNPYQNQNLDQILQKDRDTHFLDRVDEQNRKQLKDFTDQIRVKNGLNNSIGQKSRAIMILNTARDQAINNSVKQGAGFSGQSFGEQNMSAG